MKIELDTLTTCGVEADGKALELSFTDATGVPVTLRIPFERAEAIAMTLPRLLTKAMQRITSDAQSRYVFPLGSWRVERLGDLSCVVATFATADGFEASFGIPPVACRGLAWALKDEAAQIAGPAPAEADEAAVRLN